MMNVLVVGTGEYVTGFVAGAESTSDKGPGVVALVLFDLRRRGLVNEITLVGTNGRKFAGVRKHLQAKVASVYRDMDCTFTSLPDDAIDSDPTAYIAAIRGMQAGDVVIVFTPDDTHFEIARNAIQYGCHVLIAKPLVKTLEHHLQLDSLARTQDVLVAMEVHKRWDPIYVDARDRVRSLGEFSYFNSYMSQPKSQLETFRAWAGKSSDISYYLNAHHIDFNVWALGDSSRPVEVVATSANGVATRLGLTTEDTITLSTKWQNSSGSVATAIYTSSWIAPRSDVHSQQRFHYMGHAGEVSVDQAHRGYTVSTDEAGFSSPNPLFMKYVPDSSGSFAGQTGYGYRSIEDFVQAAIAIRAGKSTPEDYNDRLATVSSTACVTAILEAGRRSLDLGKSIEISYSDDGKVSSIT